MTSRRPPLTRLRNYMHAAFAVFALAACGHAEELAPDIVGQWQTDTGAVYEFSSDNSFILTYPLEDADVVKGSWELVDANHIRTVCTLMGVVKDLTRELKSERPDVVYLNGGEAIDALVLFRAVPTVPRSQWELRPANYEPLPLPAQAVARTRAEYRVTVAVEKAIHKRALEYQGYLNADGETASITLPAVFFDTPIPVNTSEASYNDLNTAIGAYLAFARAHRPSATVFDLLPFYQDDEVEALREKWTKYQLTHYAITWTRTCRQFQTGIRGYAEVGDAVYIIANRVTVLRKIDGRWRVSSMPENEFASWALPKALASNSVERVN